MTLFFFDYSSHIIQKTFKYKIHPSVDHISANDPVFNFARHLYLHEHEHPLFKFPHECLACDFKTPYTVNAQLHIKRQGPFHNNKCPNCEERFFIRSAFIDHFKEYPLHEGYVCGICELVFKDEEAKNRHRKKRGNHGKLWINPRKGKKVPPKANSEDQQCPICGKLFSTNSGKSVVYKLNKHVKTCGKNLPRDWVCEDCGVGCTSKDLLRSHRQVHNKIVCKECGKMFRKKAMASHITRAHTENHLKPYICKICGKGFPVPQNYR